VCRGCVLLRASLRDVNAIAGRTPLVSCVAHVARHRSMRIVSGQLRRSCTAIGRQCFVVLLACRSAVRCAGTRRFAAVAAVRLLGIVWRRRQPSCAPRARTYTRLLSSLSSVVLSSVYASARRVSLCGERANDVGAGRAAAAACPIECCAARFQRRGALLYSFACRPPLI
jgi:hypothetical protein